MELTVEQKMEAYKKLLDNLENWREHLYNAGRVSSVSFPNDFLAALKILFPEGL